MKRAIGFSSSEQFDLDVNQYGQTIVSPSYVCDKIKLLPHNPIIKKYTEGFWWEHQDLWVIEKKNNNPRSAYIQVECGLLFYYIRTLQSIAYLI